MSVLRTQVAPRPTDTQIKKIRCRLCKTETIVIGKPVLLFCRRCGARLYA